MSLQAAVYGRLNSLFPEVHVGLAPAGTPFPYVVMQPPSEFPPEYDTGGNCSFDAMVSISVFTILLADATQHLDSIRMAFELQPLELSSGSVLIATAGSRELLLDPERADAGQEVWHGIQQIEFLAARRPGE